MRRDREDADLRVELRYFEGCAHWMLADQRLRSLADELDLELSWRLVESPEEAEALDFLGSPSVIVDGHDPFSAGDELVGLSCRIFQTPDGPAGSPTVAQLREVLS